MQTEILLMRVQPLLVSRLPQLLGVPSIDIACLRRPMVTCDIDMEGAADSTGGNGSR